MHANIDAQSISLIAELLRDGLKWISKIQSHCANIIFSGKIKWDRIFQQVTHKGGESEINYIKIFQVRWLCKFL